MVRAYNDWHIEEWCGTYPGRFIPCSLPAIWDPEVLADEVRRTARMGAHAVTFSENPSKLGYPSFHSDHWDPFWQACSDEQVVACLHIGSSSQLIVTAPDAPIDCLITLSPINIVQAAADLVWSPIFRKFPDLKVALSEGGIGWIPYLLERIDYSYGRHHAWTGQDFGGRLPSEVFNEHVLTCFIDDRFGVANREFLNLDHVMWECDYPHSDSTWPFSPEKLAEHLEGVSDDDIDRMTHRNAMRHFQYDPFAALGGREHCTVAALRANARSDTTSRSDRQTRRTRGRTPLGRSISWFRISAETGELTSERGNEGDSMELRPFGQTGLDVSAIGFGCWEVGGGYGDIEEAEFDRAVDRALDLGINCFDTAEGYGMGASEQALGQALGSRRDEAIIVTKFGMNYRDKPNFRDSSRERVVASIDKSLKNLGTDYVDVYIVHWPDRQTPFEETMGALDDLVQDGKVRFVGLSNFKLEEIEACMAVGASTSCSTAGTCSTGACSRRSFRTARSTASASWRTARSPSGC